MKTAKKKGAAVAAFLLLILLVLLPAGSILGARAEGAFTSFSIGSYDVSMEVSHDRTVAVTETFSVTFSPYADVHGVIRDLPLDSGVRYTDIEASCSSADFAPFTETDDPNFLSLYLRGSGSTSGQERTYTLAYKMYVPALGEGYLPLDVIGYGWQCPIADVSVRIVAEGMEEFLVHSGGAGSTGNAENVTVTREGDVLLLTADRLSFANRWGEYLSAGITVDLRFGEGVLTHAPDPSLWLAAAFGGGLLLLALFLKAVFFRPPLIVEPVNLTAPDEMDPLLMGKIIDDKVDSEDFGAVIFYLAEKKYLKIDFRDEDDPRLVQTYRDTAELPAHIGTIYNGLFRSRDEVRASELTARFYTTAEKAKRQAEQAAGPTFTSASRTMIGVFLALSVLVLGLFVLLYSRSAVFADYFYWGAFVACGLSYAIAAAGSYTAKTREYKWGIGRRALSFGGGLLLGLLPCLIFLLCKNAAFGFATGFLLVLFAALTGSVAGQFLQRRAEHAKRLGDILGFRRFILFTEKNKIAFMLKEDPELYYHVLPYAQVLGVTDAWTEKFEGLDIAPPDYAMHYHGMVLDLVLWNSFYRNVAFGLARSMVSRPSSSGGGFHGGGFGGGSGGGGFGGGGGRAC